VKYHFALLVGAAVLIAATGCSHVQRGAQVDKPFRTAISPDAQSLFSVKLDKLKATDVYRQHEQQLDLPQFNEMAQRVGLDPRRDLSNVFVVWDGKNLLLLAQGAIPASQLEAKLTANGAQRVSAKNFTLFTRGADSVSFPEGGLAVAGPTSVVESALALRSSRSGGVPVELKERLAEVPADSQIWEVSRGGLPMANFPLRPDMASNLSNIAAFVSGTSLGLRFDSGTHLQVLLICKSPEGAQRIQDTLRGLIGLARLSTHDNELDLLRMWDAISISKDQQTVHVQMDLPADLTDKLIAQLSILRGRAGGILSPR
jgi:hypothetical protein